MPGAIIDDRPSGQPPPMAVSMTPSAGTRSCRWAGAVIDSERCLTPTRTLPLRSQFASVKTRSNHLPCMDPDGGGVSFDDHLDGDDLVVRLPQLHPACHSQRAALRRTTTSTIAPPPIASARCTATLTGTRLPSALKRETRPGTVKLREGSPS